MNYFHYRDKQLLCEEVPVADIAREIGTPFYLYSFKTLKHHFNVFDRSFAAVPHIVCYAVKANSNVALLRAFVREGGGVDIVSGGELYRALKAGADPRKIVYSGVGKRDDEIEYAIKTNILMFNVESTQELERIDACAGRLGRKAGIAIRVNPDVDPETHPYISTGLKENKFGINLERSLNDYRLAMHLKNIDIRGVSCHIGSQLTKVTPFVDALSRIRKLIGLLAEEGIAVKYLDLGGGLGITYDGESPPHPTEYAREIIAAAVDLKCTFIFEPGRVIVGNAGILVTKVLFTKSNEDKHFIIVDAGMNDLVRPSLYGSFHAIQPVSDEGREEITADVVGPICESGDYLAKKRNLPRFERDDLMAVMSAGAYGFTMSSNYNSRPRVAEVMVTGSRFYVIREREDYADMVRHEKMPDFLKKL